MKDIYKTIILGFSDVDDIKATVYEDLAKVFALNSNGAKELYEALVEEWEKQLEVVRQEDNQ